ncbi:hypothetical protein BCR35DRAFT_102006 [Leucosporidium creatinivorum]|uniref:Uncharacterized protein n=1 Tax=Leucosporidium creatinivorum TaxID=106004 RepID=A0A1Y2F654_9BASI|nr:hypothetical protein BCR35DRAFT_102006 [Leucosporidium creatinivorum]
MHLRSLTSPSPTPPPSTPSLPTSSTINSHAQLATPSDSYPTQSSTESARPPRTPPSTPIPTYQQHQQPVTMWALTASKLERAAQAQMSGSRGAGGLRELVLLSNVWGAARPLWAQEQAEREREQVELERRRKEDEERWLDGVLEEMLEEEEGDEDFVSLTFVEREEVGDSGFLEEEQKVVVQRLRESLDAIEEEEGDSDAEVEAELRPSPRVGEAARDYPLPPSPPLPPRSPPISLPSPNRAHHHHLPFDLDHAFAESDLSSSPPLHLPALTPDSTPPGPGLASDLALLGTSADSVDSNLDDSYQWVQDRSTAQRLGLLALDLSTPSQKRGDPPSSLSLDMISLSRQHPHGLLPSESDSIPLYHHPNDHHPLPSP